MTKLKRGDPFAYEWAASSSNPHLCWGIFNTIANGMLDVIAAKPVWASRHGWHEYPDVTRITDFRIIKDADTDEILADWTKFILLNGDNNGQD